MIGHVTEEEREMKSTNKEISILESRLASWQEEKRTNRFKMQHLAGKCIKHIEKQIQQLRKTKVEQ